MNKRIINQTYHQLLNDLKTSVASAKYKAALHVNKALVCLYHHIGSRILHTQVQERWGTGVITELSKDLRAAFPEMKGFSPQNLKYMRKFAQVYDQDEIGQQAVDQIPWGHIVLLIYSGLSKIQQKFYIECTIKNGWSRNNLSMQIETNLYERQSGAITNFDKQLPPSHAALAQATLKNPYLFDFLSLGDEAHERELEKGLVAHIEKFLKNLFHSRERTRRVAPVESRKPFYLVLNQAYHKLLAENALSHFGQSNRYHYTFYIDFRSF